MSDDNPESKKPIDVSNAEFYKSFSHDRPDPKTNPPTLNLIPPEPPKPQSPSTEATPSQSSTPPQKSDKQ